MILNALRDNERSRYRNKRPGRGIGSGHAKPPGNGG